ncbi:hypothetical protein M409DRAFT_50286 [Zasmidium cellare ATCC 36951]|uniref:Uncharacterized protein n=1 Tax=Zasmidium cellare ATCC 36951 TaxID=1080233 RepID=A0A6A6CWX2_ZASCE|nr:uncharacterized protein M409DRAFT_50286 [Zasmidium cellare ATCC 36951]KAF2171611.1 hypothetical protein M409DRAFT_50286 [Zasmidium cellare ATCC 36951]
MDIHLPLVTLLLTTLTTTHPINPRAGGPIGKPIPQNCTQTNPLPHPKNNNHPNGPISGYKPSADFTSTNLLHASYFPTSLQLPLATRPTMLRAVLRVRRGKRVSERVERAGDSCARGVL